MRFALTVTGPAYGTQQASSAWQFAQAVLQEGHELACVFFYREGTIGACLGGYIDRRKGAVSKRVLGQPTEKVTGSQPV